MLEDIQSQMDQVATEILIRFAHSINKVAFGGDLVYTREK